jgi:hypothetical protein
LEFYDLSMDDGAKITRLVLRQGTASFYVNPNSADYFSVTGGDFTVEATGKASFRLDDFDDGSNLNILKGHVNLVEQKKTTALEKGQSFSVHANDAASAAIGRVPMGDEFDRWVSGRIDSAVTATTAAEQYVSSPLYTSGLADLQTYGSWYSVAGYGNCWRPYGVGFGWTPFGGGGGWFGDPFFGTMFIGSQPWGWLPYHFGSWVFDPMFGWLWDPSGFGFGFGGFFPWQPVTGRWVRNRNGGLGVVPVHPLDSRGKAPVNMNQGVFAVNAGGVSGRVPVTAGEEWKTVKAPPRGFVANNIVTSSVPQHVFRTAGNTVGRPVSTGGASSIAFDSQGRRFVDNEGQKTEQRQSTATAVNGNRANTKESARVPEAATTMNGRSSAATPPSRSTPPPRPAMRPPAPSAQAQSARGATEGRGSTGASGASPTWRSSGPSPSRSSSPSASAPRASAPAASSGRPH